ncbi:MAG: type II toxin-antitoxin system RelE/ParE family toxin [Deltaproteobacteria bacterium]|nr:type II toxin-antitoxin system RelE/ParE family toxin [Deltaproteobacteria bacterium]
MRRRSGSPPRSCSPARAINTSVKPVTLATEASEEFVETVEFYERRRVGLGAAFISEFERSVELIQQYPESGRSIGKDFRRILTNRFPYALIYVEREAGYFVIAVAHTSRRPGYWKERIADAE